MTAGAEAYYRVMVAGGPASWNVCDCHMGDTLDRLVAHHGQARDSALAKAVVWEDNTHVGDTRCTDMTDAGLVNVGQLIRERHDEDEVVLVGFGSHRQTVVAAGGWGVPGHAMPVPPARPGSPEALLHDSITASAALFVFPAESPDWLTEERDHRAIGVVYHPDAERWGNYVPTVSVGRYNAFCWSDQTTALSLCTTCTPPAGNGRPGHLAGDDMAERAVQVRVGDVRLDGDLAVPTDARGVVVFAHGSGSSRHSPRNRYVAAGLAQAGFATLLMDLLTVDEEQVDVRTRELRFDIPRLAARLTGAVDWLAHDEDTAGLPVATFGASTGAAAALITAADRPERVRGVISRGGRPDLAGDALSRVAAATLLIVGGNDPDVLDLNEHAATRLTADVEVAVVPGATHLFEEPGALDTVIDLATGSLARWSSAW